MFKRGIEHAVKLNSLPGTRRKKKERVQQLKAVSGELIISNQLLDWLIATALLQLDPSSPRVHDDEVGTGLRGLALHQDGAVGHVHVEQVHLMEYWVVVARCERFEIRVERD
jgi:hypothetical protein